MKVIRAFERRLETLLDGVVGRVFGGPLHPVELAGRIVREADLATRRTDIGPTTANHYLLALNPADLDGSEPPPELEVELSRVVEEAAFERGWRLDGPGRAVIVADQSVPPGSVRCVADTRPGPRPAWATLTAAAAVPVTVNRAVIGRGSSADVVVGDDRTSRRHALLWREGDRILLRDLGSANGTRVEGRSIGHDTVEVESGSRVSFGDSTFRLEVRPPGRAPG